MAILIYPSNNLLLARSSSVPGNTVQVLATQPQSIVFFDTGSGISAISASYLPISVDTASFVLGGGGGGSNLTTGSTVPITASQAISASFAPGSSPANYTSSLFGTSSWSVTASFALNGGTGGSNLTTGSIVPITASQAVSASFAPGGVAATYTSSLFGTASWATNVVGGLGSIITGSLVPITSSWAGSVISASGILYPYVTHSLNLTSSTNWITCSFLNPNQKVDLTLTGSYNFTASNPPIAGMTADVLLYISNSVASGTSSLTFPSNWTNIGAGWPTSIAARSLGIVWLRAHGASTIFGTYNVSGATPSASYAITASFALNGGGGGSNLATGSLVPITASWASNVVGGIGQGSIITGSLIPITSSQAITASFALNGGTGGSNLSTGSLVPITSSWALNSLTSSIFLITSSVSASWASQSAFAPVIFTGFQIINGIPLLLSDLGTGSWFALGVHDDGSGSYTTQLSPTINTGSVYASGSLYVITSSLQITSSISASWASRSFSTDSSSWASSSFSSSFAILATSSSYATTASFALNGGGGGGGSNLATGSLVPITSSFAITSSFNTQTAFGYVTNITSSTNWITCSFLNPNQSVNLTLTASYNFTRSNVPAVGQVSDVLLYISHSVNSGTSSLTFPSNWKNLGNGWPSSIAANTLAVLWLRSIDTSSVIGTYNASGSVSSAGSNLATGSLVPITSSQAISASYAPGSATANYTSSLFGTASWAVSASFSPGGAAATYTSSLFGTASWATNVVGGIGQTTIITGSLIPITSSVATTASYANDFIRELTTGSTYQITSSQAVSASFAPGGASYTSSLFGTASWSSQALTSSYVSPYSVYQTDVTSSANWITCSFLNTNQQVNLTVAGLYNFTASDMPASGQVSDLIVNISHSVSTATSSLSFPSTWITLGAIFPNQITASKNASVWLRAVDTSKIIGVYLVQP